MAFPIDAEELDSLEVTELPEEELSPELEPEEELEEIEEPETVPELTQELRDLLKDIINKVEIEEEPFRAGQLQLLKKLDNFWHGIQRLYWSTMSQDWVTMDGALVNNPDLADQIEGEDTIVNIYKAHGESVIAALSQSIPAVKFFPADADNPADILSAKGYSRIAELVQKHNKAQVLYTQALFTLWNQHFVAAFHYPVEDEKFGIVEKPRTKEVPVTTETPACPNCGADVLEDSSCPTCGPVEPVMIPKEEMQVEEDEPEVIVKSRQAIRIYGPLNVMIPHNISDMSDAGILVLYTEQDVAKLRAKYYEIAEEINPTVETDAWYREMAGSLSDLSGKVTVKEAWLEPWMYWRLGDTKRDKVQELYKLYPDGCYVVIIDNKVFEAHNEPLNKRWTVSKSPLSRTIHADPIGKTLLSIQESRNDLYSLSLETVKHGIPETFFDAEVLNTAKYNEIEAKPGLLFPVKKRPGQSIGDSFHQLRTATLSKEIDSFGMRLDSDAQFLSGASPTIYGGDVGGSQTAKEYETRRSQALQRLQLHWKTLTHWWAELMSKVVVDYAKSLLEDEKFIVARGNSFMNIWIRKSEIEGGEIGQIEPDVSDQFPISAAQKKDLLVQILQMNNDFLNSVVYHPENATLVAQIMGFPEIYIPGDEDRSKQLNEINSILNGEQAMVEQPVDNHPVHAEVAKAWLNSEAGIYTKTSNAPGYMKVVEHLMEHLQLMQPPPMPQDSSNQSEQEGNQNGNNVN